MAKPRVLTPAAAFDEAPIFLDYQSTTPLDPRVLEAMTPFLEGSVGNPHSSHSLGQSMRRSVEQAREMIASSIGASTDELIFTSGATEANNLALRGFPWKSRKARVVSARTEHSSVLAVLEWLEKHQGIAVDWVDVDEDGLVDLTDLERKISEHTELVTLMSVNNETGVIQSIEDIATICHERSVAFHTDGAQALGKVEFRTTSGLSMASLSSHKAYGPAGIGALYCSRNLKDRLEPLLVGGGQEDGIRAGTVPVALAVGFGRAAELAHESFESDSARYRQFFDAMLSSLEEGVPGAQLNGSVVSRHFGNLNIYLPDVDSEVLVQSLREVAVS
ncbi:MAG: cysteine desulfurase family protein, partial [Acidiferrobacterales bacterium]|nr:cysteine desulfurase family protein [Acidiferrobacterales bacterium]